MAASTLSMWRTRLWSLTYSLRRANASARFMVGSPGAECLQSFPPVYRPHATGSNDRLRRRQFLDAPAGDGFRHERIRHELADVVDDHGHDGERERLEVGVVQVEGHGQRLLAAGNGDGDLLAALEAQGPAAPQARGQGRQVNAQAREDDEGDGER